MITFPRAKREGRPEPEWCKCVRVPVFALADAKQPLFDLLLYNVTMDDISWSLVEEALERRGLRPADYIASRVIAREEPRPTDGYAVRYV